MTQYRGKTGGLEEAKIYMHDKEIPQLFESMMTALMFKKPDDHLDFLEQCLAKAKKQNKVQWHTFIEPLPPIPRIENKVEQETVIDVSSSSNHQNEERNTKKQTYSPLPLLPPIASNVDVVVMNDNDDTVTGTVDNNSSGTTNETDEIDSKEGISNETDEIDSKEGIDTADASTAGEEKVVQEEGTNIDADDQVIINAIDDPSSGDNVDVSNEKSDDKDTISTTNETAEVENDDVQVGSQDVISEKNIEETEVNVEEDEVEVEVSTSVENVEVEKSSEKEADTAADVIIDVPEWNGDSSTQKEDVTLQAFSKPVIFVLGGPGSGKGTQCTKIVEKYSFLHLSAGDLLRQEATKGGEIAAIMEQGQLVPQGITIGLIKQAMLDNHDSKGFLIDGFPREVQQGQTFESEVTSPKLVLNYSCPDEILVERLIARGKHSGRVDDNEESIKKRLDLFHSKSEPVFGHYGDAVKTIDSSQPVDKVFEDTCEVLDQLNYSDGKSEIEVEEPIVVAVEDDIIPGKGQMSHLFDDIKNKSFVFVAGFEGCGKKELCNKIVQNFGYTLIAVAEILLAEIQTGTDRAQVVSDTFLNGGVVSLEIIMELVGEAILNLDNVDKVLIDGFPRNISEVEEFESQIAAAKKFIYFSCPFETLIEKLGSSENDKVIENQLESFHTTVLPILDKYKERGLGVEISMQSSEADVSVSIQKVFDESTDSTDNAMPDFYGH